MIGYMDKFLSMLALKVRLSLTSNKLSLSLAKEKQFGAALLGNFADSSFLYRSFSMILYCLCFPLPHHLMHVHEKATKILKEQHEEVFHLWS